MIKIFKILFKAKGFILYAVLLSTMVMILQVILHKQPPAHPLDFQNASTIVIDHPIHTVEDGLPYALSQAQKWREDAVLTGVGIESIGKEEIEKCVGKVWYRFEFNYINKSKPSGVLIVSLNINTNSIDSVQATHINATVQINEFNWNDLSEHIKEVYDTAIKHIGTEAIFQYQQPCVRVHLNSEYASFEVSPSKAEQNLVIFSIKIDMGSYEIVDFERN